MLQNEGRTEFEVLPLVSETLLSACTLDPEAGLLEFFLFLCCLAQTPTPMLW